MNDSMNMTKAFNGGIDQLESFDFRRREILHKERRDFVRRQNRGVRKICRGGKDESLQTAFVLYILAKGEDIVDGKRIGVLMECSGAERRRNDNRLIPYAH